MTPSDQQKNEEHSSSGTISHDTTPSASVISESIIRRNTVHIQPCYGADDATTLEDEESTIDIGTKVDKNHTNFLLMYNMLTGIRMGVLS
jgi:hypothetical protein